MNPAIEMGSTLIFVSMLLMWFSDFLLTRNTRNYIGFMLSGFALGTTGIVILITGMLDGGML